MFPSESWSFMYIIKSKGTEINPWGTHVLLFPNLIKHFAFHYIIFFYVFLICICWVVSEAHLCAPLMFNALVCSLTSDTA
jgi:hypothetical protein